MGCDFYYRGCLKDHKAQEDVVELASQFYDKKGRIVVPEPDKTFLAEIYLDRPENYKLYSPPPTIEDHECPFDFYGLIPYSGMDIFDCAQFVFHRCQKRTLAYIQNRDGMLVTLERFPQQFNIPPGYVEQIDADCFEPFQLIVNNRGYLRCGGGYNFALLLHLIKLRWMPDLWMGDDYGNCDHLGQFIEHYGLTEKFSCQSVTFEECWRIVEDIQEEEQNFRKKKHDGPAEVVSLVEAREKRTQE